MQSYDQQRGLVHLARCELATYSFDGQRLAIDPVVYPGVRIVAAWKNGALAALSTEDAALYEEAQAIVSAAKAASGGGKATYITTSAWLPSTTARRTNPSRTSVRRLTNE